MEYISTLTVVTQEQRRIGRQMERKGQSSSLFELGKKGLPGLQMPDFEMGRMSMPGLALPT